MAEARGNSSVTAAPPGTPRRSSTRTFKQAPTVAAGNADQPVAAAADRDLVMTFAAHTPCHRDCTPPAAAGTHRAAGHARVRSR